MVFRGCCVVNMFPREVPRVLNLFPLSITTVKFQLNCKINLNPPINSSLMKHEIRAVDIAKNIITIEKLLFTCRSVVWYNFFLAHVIGKNNTLHERTLTSSGYLTMGNH